MKPPRLRGQALRFARIAAESGTSLVSDALKKTLGIDRLRALPHSLREPVALTQEPLRARESHSLPSEQLSLPAPSEWPKSAKSYTQAYLEKKSDPTRVAERALSFLSELEAGRKLNVLNASLPALSRADAEASAARYREGKPKGPLDGVPFLVKDEFDVAGLPTTLGSRCESTDPKAEHSTAVARLRDAGAIFLGKTNLTEWGMSPLGQNKHFTMPHNAHHPLRVPGGSSTGSAVGVALGIAPIALGGDGGGSIRIPASLNGVFGIKPTFGRVSRAGDGFLGSVAHAGPIGSTPLDLAVALDVLASVSDDRDPLTAWAPPPPEGGFGARLTAGVKGLRIGVPAGEWAEASEVVQRVGQAAIAALEKSGAILVPIDLPIAKNAAPIGYFSIGCESLGAVRDHWDHRREMLSDDLRISYAVLDGIKASEYVDAQMLRSALRSELQRVLRDVDVIAMPTTATAAPEMPEADRFGTFSDAPALDAMCRFSFLGNLTGLPAGTAPVGDDAEGLPIGLQIIGDAWQEHTVLGVLQHLERLGFRAKKPSRGVDLLRVASPS